MHEAYCLDLTVQDATALNEVTNVRFCILTEATGWGPPAWLPVVPTMKFSSGYRFMIRFYAITIWTTLSRLGYKWVMRMDDDSFVLSPVNYNVFGDMRAHGLYYGYRTLSRECPVIFGDFIDSYTTHAHWKDNQKDDGELDYGPSGLVGLTSQAESALSRSSRSSNMNDDSVATSFEESEELDEESRHIIKFCGTWPRHCRRAEMQAALALAFKKARLVQGKDKESDVPATLIQQKRWATWYCSGPGQLGYYNNWFVTNVTWWATNPAATRLMRAFDRSNLIFTRRCNDLIFQTAVVKLFMPKSLRKRYTDFTYQHHTVSSGAITFGGIETGHLDPNPAGNLEQYREKFLSMNSSGYIKVRVCNVQSVYNGPLHKTYYISPAADQQKHDAELTTTVLVNRFESPYCGQDERTLVE